MAAEWFYQAKGQQWGPVLSAELRRLADTGILTPDTLVCRATATGMADGRWVRTAKVQGLFQSPPSPPPLPPGVPLVQPDSPRRLNRRLLAGVLAAAGTVIVVLLATILLLHHGGNEVVSAPTSQVPVAQSGWDAVSDVRMPAKPAAQAKSQQSAQPPAQQPAASPPSLSPKGADTAILSDNSVYDKTVLSVVVIRSFRGETPIAAGSGFVLNPGDRVVTNEHVIRGASIVRACAHDGRSDRVTCVMAVDEDRDIAVLPVPQALAGMRGLRLADAPPKVGDAVFALGSPLGLEFTFTKGIVSQFRRDFGPYGSVVQTDVSLSPGSSGGPLVNRRGQVVGMSTLASRAVAEAHNLNFAVSAEEIAAVCKRQEFCACQNSKAFRNTNRKWSKVRFRDSRNPSSRPQRTRPGRSRRRNMRSCRREAGISIRASWVGSDHPKRRRENGWKPNARRKRRKPNARHRKRRRNLSMT